MRLPAGGRCGASWSWAHSRAPCRAPGCTPGTCSGSGGPALSDIAELLVSEIVTNAIQVSQADMDSAPVRLWLLADRSRLLILVWDASPLPPVRVSSSADAENSRGLLLVETISARWGWHFLPDKGGKVVWALTILE